MGTQEEYYKKLADLVFAKVSRNISDPIYVGKLEIWFDSGRVVNFNETQKYGLSTINLDKAIERAYDKLIE